MQKITADNMHKVYNDARRDEKEAEKKKREEGAENKSFFNLQDAEMADEPYVFRVGMKAMENGLESAYALRNAYWNHTDPQYQSAIKAMADAGNDFFRLQKNCVTNALKNSGGKVFVPRNTDYENKMLSCLNSSNPDDQGVLNEWKDALKKRWHDGGYFKDGVDDEGEFIDFLMSEDRSKRLSVAKQLKDRVHTIVDAHFGDSHTQNMYNSVRPERSAASDKMKKLREKNEIPEQEG
jgi:hypothetical protein